MIKKTGTGKYLYTKLPSAETHMCTMYVLCYDAKIDQNEAIVSCNKSA